MNFKNFKIVRKIQDISPKLRWKMFSKLQECKIASRYIDYLIPDVEKDINKDNERLTQMVRETFIKEFSPKIQELKSFEKLVEATVHNIKQKQLQESGDFEEIEF